MGGGKSKAPKAAEPRELRLVEMREQVVDWEKFKSDVELIVSNALLFNPPSQLHDFSAVTAHLPSHLLNVLLNRVHCFTYDIFERDFTVIMYIG